VLQMLKCLSLTISLTIVGFLVGCAEQQPIVTKVAAANRDLGRMHQVRTTAYTRTEKGGRHNALGTYLSGRHVMSAASDWSRFPLGTRFRIVDTKEEYMIDDYGTALIGTSTIDLYKPTRLQMKRWGVRNVDIDILQWGSEEESLRVLGPRAKHRTVRQMIAGLQKKSPAQSSPGAETSNSSQASARKASIRTLD
jgi:3D (Asp-Asp-Asp) domain-containing protein